MQIKYVLCEVESYFDEELDQSMNKVVKPLQMFDTATEAEKAYDLFSPFYDYNVRVVPSNMLGQSFR